MAAVGTAGRGMARQVGGVASDGIGWGKKNLQFLEVMGGGVGALVCDPTWLIQTHPLQPDPLLLR